jgi:RHH-type proline utilization regulon transcriptional repressor/proline dehydrogenase/delta 1-pyrroline-5-carboxylate dehydrogenase
MQSVFRSAGQRCSSLRVLCVHEAVADDVLAMIIGALAELRVADPADWTTDVGPVIDACARQRLLAQIGALGAVAPGPPAVMANLLQPQIIETGRLSEVREEIFGPVLQVLRWRGDPAQVIRDVNALGYGLTLGLQTRIDGRAESLARLACVGNVYVNRGMTGAVVGVQPFGGDGLSGTGPKAGGPHYLLRFCTEQTITINLTAAGGNIDLLAR